MEFRCDRNDIIDRDSGLRARELDKESKIKNPWKWEWLETEVNIDEKSKYFLREVIRKLDKPGYAYCLVCKKELNYGSRGMVTLKEHCNKGNSNKHRNLLKLRKSNYTLGSAFTTPSSTTSTSSSSMISHGHGEAGSSGATSSKPYGLHPMFAATGTALLAPNNVPLPYTPISDRAKTTEATILGFIAEENLPFAIAPKLVDLIKQLSKDKKALEMTSMSRTTASYKMKYGVGKTFEDELIEDIKNTYFTLNIDEATSTNNWRVLSIMVSYFSEAHQEVIVRHLKSVNVLKVNAETLYKAIVDLFEENQIPWTNLIAILMDSCAVMRGAKSGVETRIRQQKAPHLLDINGDSCHHIHNAAKKLSAPFEYHLEGLVKDLFHDLQYSADLRDMLREVCQILGIKYTGLQDYISHRWLSMYDRASDLNRLFPALTVLYAGFLVGDDKVTYLSTVMSIYRQYDVSIEARKRIKEIQKACEKRTGMTSEGKDRKKRIIRKLFHLRKKTRLQLGFYLSVLPLLQKYVKTFEKLDPLIYKLHDYQEELFQDLLQCFIKSETLIKEKKVWKIDVDNPVNRLKKEDMFTGHSAEAIIKSSTRHNPVVVDFRNQAMNAYAMCVKQLQKSMPMENDFLVSVSAVDPKKETRGHTETLKCLLKLPSIVHHVIPDSDIDEYQMDCRTYVSSKHLPTFDTSSRADKWWSLIRSKFPVLTRMTLAVLSCFHGPQVESSFSSMNEIVDKKSGSLSIETFDALQTVKYHLRSAKKTSIEYFKKQDYRHEQVDPKLCKNLKQARQKLQQIQEQKKKETKAKCTELKVKPTKPASKRKFQVDEEEKAKKARLTHVHRIMKINLKGKGSSNVRMVKKKQSEDSEADKTAKARQSVPKARSL